MILLIDVAIIISSIVATLLLYILYYQIFIIGYIRRIQKEIAKGNIEKANKMKSHAIRKQPKRMKSLFKKYDIESV